jgi:glucose/arabinose dehydrogenase
VVQAQLHGGRRWAALGLVVTVVLAACGDSSSPPPTSSPPSGSKAPIGSPTPPAASSAAATASLEPPPVGPPPALKLTPEFKVDSPVAMAVRPGSHDLYVVEQAGQVRHVVVAGSGPAATYTVDPQPWLDLTAMVHSGGEQGLLGIAFAPDGAHVYLSFTGLDQRQYLNEVAVDAAGSARPETRRVVLGIDDFAPNHNGGQLTFGPDGFLYWGMGDGGGGGDPKANGQNPNDLLGDILRIDPKGDPYFVPADNPFVKGGGAPEVFAYGLRNPWRFSFDAKTGDLWIGDVGQDKYEEIDRLVGGKPFGANFGWNAMEGTHPFKGKAPANAVAPVYDYSHDGGGCSVIAGFAYRGAAIPGLAGTVVFGDYCDPAIRGLRPTGSGDAVAPVDLGLRVTSLTSFGQGADGELYTLSLDGNVSLLTSA